MSEGKKSGSGKPRRESIKFIPKPVPYRIAQTVTETGKTIASKCLVSAPHHQYLILSISDKTKGDMEIWME